MLGGGIIQNFPLFFGGNIAPDAVHAKKDYQRADKKHTHLCDGITSYGYGYPESNQLFKDGVRRFAARYAGAAKREERDLYLGYIVHLLADELEMFSACERLENQLKNRFCGLEVPVYRHKLADEIRHGEHRNFFIRDAVESDRPAYAYRFQTDAVAVLEAVWDYEIRDDIPIRDIISSKRWVIDTVFKSEPTQYSPAGYDGNRMLLFIDSAAEHVSRQLRTMGLL